MNNDIVLSLRSGKGKLIASKVFPIPSSFDMEAVRAGRVVVMELEMFGAKGIYFFGGEGPRLSSFRVCHFEGFNLHIDNQKPIDLHVNFQQPG